MNDYYKKISMEDFNRYKSNFIKFTQKDVSNFKKFISNYSSNKFNTDFRFDEMSIDYLLLSSDDDVIYIYKHPDDWYMIHNALKLKRGYATSFFKCDQWDGLLEYTKNQIFYERLL